MLGNFMEDLGITPQQFEDACNRQNTDRIPIPFDQVILFNCSQHLFQMRLLR